MQFAREIAHDAANGDARNGTEQAPSGGLDGLGGDIEGNINRRLRVRVHRPKNEACFSRHSTADLDEHFRAHSLDNGVRIPFEERVLRTRQVGLRQVANLVEQPRAGFVVEIFGRYRARRTSEAVAHFAAHHDAGVFAAVTPNDFER